MNLRQPYEQLIADKLRRLPARDANTSWQQMKRLLDNDEDTKAGGGKRPPGGWWRMGIVAIVLFTSLWLYIGQKKSSSGMPVAKNNTTAPSSAKDQVSAATGNSVHKINSTNNNQKTTIDKNITSSGINATSTSGKNDTVNDGPTPALNSNNTKTNTAVKNSIVLPTGKVAEKNPVRLDHTGNTVAAATDNTVTNKTNYTNKKDLKSRTVLISLAGTTKENNAANNGGKGHNDFRLVTEPLQKHKKNTGVHATDTNETIEPLTDNTTLSEKSSGKMKHIAESNHQNSITGVYLPINQATAAINKSWLQQLDGIETPVTVPSFNPSLSIGDSMANSRNINGLLNNETKKLVAKTQRDKALEDMSKKDKKSFHLNLSNLFKPFSLHMDADPRWAAGIALNTAIPLNAQNRYNYNVNAKSGILTDYIPSVYLQFHLNDYVYAQTEINFISPQYTPQLLVYQQSSALAGQTGINQQKSIYIQKLYYFNLPLSLHYSPINNLYFSAGIQFSSFQSGLVSIQQKQYASLSGPDHPSSISNSVVKFKDDSIAGMLSPNEWRWQAGAEYYWNRFTIGLRYNRSFKNLFTVPQPSLHNESLLLAVRYNLFESRKKGSGEQKN